MNTKATPSTLLFITILIVATLAPFAGDLYIPSLPAITEHFDTSANLVQLSVGFYFLGLALSLLVYGPVSDRLGRKPVVLFGLVVSIVGTLMCIWAPSVTWLLAGRAIQGAGMGASALFRSMLRDVYDGSTLAKMGSYIGMGFAVSVAIAPALGGLLQLLFGWNANFIFLLFYFFTVILIVYFYLPETHYNTASHPTRYKHIISNYWTLTKNIPFMGYAICAGFSFAGILAYLTVTPFIFQELVGLNAFEYGLLALWISTMVVIGSWINAKVIDKFGVRFMLRVGLVLQLTCGGLLYLTGWLGWVNVPAIMLPLSFFVVGAALIFANAFGASFSALKGSFGAASALYGLVNTAIAAIISNIVALLPDGDQRLLGIILIVLASLCLFVMQFIIFPLEKKIAIVEVENV